ncbi:hypothetical protein [Paludibaculum fermentans]|uniref:Uncharacterized protein n=1 Tax=Paludibaculum fermentans TaxID=1473598 RepID=A0A7S7SJ89_PALFE|nr:hypothetical protein [Paludibaculum fermentans]QOY86226.1 hypothetical protein IRI77_25910 [Paludibaculum fermentans]
MASAAQVTANQANARLSTGPASAEGKAQSAQNARKHGLTSLALKIGEYERIEFDTLAAELRLQTRPTGCLEEELFHRILSHSWNLRRIETFESLILAETNPLAEPGPEAANLDRYARYRRDLERSLYRALNELRKLQTERSALLLQRAPAIQSFAENAPLADVTRLQPLVDERFSGPLHEQILAKLRFEGGIPIAIEYSQGLSNRFVQHADSGKPLAQFVG